MSEAKPKTSTRILQVVLPLLVLALTFAGRKYLMETKVEPPKKPREERSTLVETQTVSRTSRPIIVRAAGTVTHAYQVQLMAEVGGRVIWKNEQLTIGGLLRKDEPLLRIDPRDYKLAIEQQAAALEQARTEMQLESGRQRVARAEWNAFGQASEADEALALREPQLKAAELALKTARASLEQAKLQHGRTVIKAPFDAVVRDNSTDVGRLVTPGQALATLTDTRLFMVVVSVPVADLSWLKIPGTNAPILTEQDAVEAFDSEDPEAAFAELGSVARVVQSTGGEHIERSGVIVRMLGELDPVGRMARLLVGVDDPLGRDAQGAERAADGLPILLGAYVNVELQGRTIDGVIELPRRALREGDKVYLVSDKSTLQERTVDVLRKTDQAVLVRSGLSDGERVITSALASPVVGMELRVSEAPAESSAPRAALHDEAEQATEEKKAGQ